MTSKEETYCRLCAEPTLLDQLISTDCPVGLNAKISMKMLWININLNNNLPKTLCFACFDLLERTWKFLHDVRIAQTKLHAIFSEGETPREIKTDDSENIGKPVDEDWEEFQQPKVEIEVKNENPVDNVQILEVDPNSVVDVDVKCELASDGDTCNDDFGGFDSADSDLPLKLSVKKKKIKKKAKKKIPTDEEPIGVDTDQIIWDAPLNVNTWDAPISWEDYMCRCASCDAQCKNISSLRLHSLQIHSCCSNFKCLDCGKVLTNFRMFVNHVRTHKKSLRYCCEFCNKRFTRSSYIKKHINTDHCDSFLTMCDCGAVFDTLEELKDHMLMYSKGIKKRMVKQENIEAELKCEHCGKEFKSRSNLLQHRLVHTERTREFSCHVCGKMFFTKGTLSTHMMTHEDTKPFKCEYCPMAFRARGNLQSHISLHSGAKPFVCEQCGKSFRVKRHLKSHSIVHTDLMPYVCEYCNKTFRFKTRLNLHLRQHTGAKPYNCLFCQRDFTNGSNFKKHMKRRHNIDTSKKRYTNIVEDQNSIAEISIINDQNTD